MVKKKGKSKRTTLKDKYKIQTRVTEHHRKQRKQMKRDAKAGKVNHDKKKKDPGIPNSWPFKQDLLNEIKQAKERQAEKERTAKAEREDQIRQLQEHQKSGGTARSYAEMIAMSLQRAAEFDSKNNVSSSGSIDNSNKDPVGEHLGQQSRRAYLSELKKVIEASDVVLQILDARDPMSSRASRGVEELILSHADKRMVLVLNKIDLVPKQAVQGWLTYLRRSHPTVAIKAGTGRQQSSSSSSSTIGRAKGENALNSTSAVGMDGLLHLLKNYARVMDSKKGSITVGLIGYPNTGKSSIINSLKRARAVGVSSTPGFTTSMQEVVLDKNIRLIDSPGVVFCDDEGASADVSLKNCVDPGSIPDPVAAIKALLARCSQRSLMMAYAIPAFPSNDESIFLGMIAKKYGKLLKGGIPDKVAAARCVLHDWNNGKVPFYTSPPVEAEEATRGMDSKIMTSLGKEFDVSQMMTKFDTKVLDSLDDQDPMDFVEIKPTAEEEESEKVEPEFDEFEAEEEDESGSEEEMDDDEDDNCTNIKATAPITMLNNASIAEAEDYDFAT